LAGSRGTLGCGAADSAVRQQATALVTAAFGAGTPVAEAAIDRRPALPKATAQVHVQVGDVVSTQVIVGAIDVLTARIVPRDLAAVPIRAATLAEAAARRVAAGGDAAAADHAVSLAAVRVALADLRQA